MLDKSKGGIQFSIYYPQEISPNSRTRLTAYVFKMTATDAVIQDVQSLPNKYEPRLLTEDEQQRFHEFPLVTVTLDRHVLQIHVDAWGSYFLDDWERFDFEVSMPLSSIHQFNACTFIFSVDSMIVAEIPISIYVTEQPNGKIASIAHTPFQLVYYNYSDEDIGVVERIERTAEILELNYLDKLIKTRNNSKHNPELLTMIEQADIFQLFWSEAAAQADYVETQWRYAHQLGRPNFIRAVYWLDPMPSLPSELANISILSAYDLWIELKYHKMPIEHLNLSDQSIEDLHSVGVYRVSELMDWFAITHAVPNAATPRLNRHYDEFLSALDAISAQLPKQYR